MATEERAHETLGDCSPAFACRRQRCRLVLAASSAAAVRCARVAVAYLLAIIGVGLFISSLAKAQQQAILGVFSFNVPAILLSGFATPLENKPAWLRWTGTINPIRYFMIISKGIFLEGIKPQVVLNNLWPLLLIATATLTAAGWLFRRRLE